MKMIEVSLLTTQLLIINPPNPSTVFLKTSKPKAKTFQITASASSNSTPHSVSSGTLNQTLDVHRNPTKKRVFFLDVNPLCYAGSKPSLRSFAHWVELFFSQVSNTDPVIAVLDGERGGDYRRELLPSYKAHRRQFLRDSNPSRNLSMGYVGRSFQVIKDVLQNCNVPVIKIVGHEADDVVATLDGSHVRKLRRAATKSLSN